jgi:hypothetical protein
MSSPTERAAAGGGAAARPESAADPPPTAPAADGGAPGDAADSGATGEAPWFLRAGRAGLAPEAVTVVAQPGENALASLQLAARPDVTGLPPWADELPGPAPDTLPPWEAGPWPSYQPPGRDPGGAEERHDRDPFAGHFADIGPFTGPGPFPGRGAASPASEPSWGAAARPDAESPSNRPRADYAAAGTSAGPGPGASATLGPVPAAGPLLDPSLAAGTTADPPRAGGALEGFRAANTALDPRRAADAAQRPGGPATGRAAAANPLGTAALVAGVLGIAVLPGVVLGILGLRRAAVTGTGRWQSWLGIALSLAWAAGIIFLAWPGPGPAADPGCVQYRASGTAAVARVTSALPPKVLPARLGAGLGPAANAVNDATASAQNIDVRNTLAALNSDLQAEQAAALAGRPAPAALGVTLAADAAAAAHLCGVSS